MRVLIADKLAAHVPAALELLGCEVEVRPELGEDDLPEMLGGASVLVVRSTRVTAAALEAAPQLALVIRAGAGVNTIDLATASARGVYVANCLGKNTAAVAELTIGLLIAADRRIADATQSLRTGAWRKKAFGDAQGLKGRTLGILGLGEIGRAVAQRAAGLGMRVIAWSRSLTPELAESWGMQAVETPLALAAASDAVSLHLASTAETRNLINAEFLSAMRPGAILVNAARGDLIDAPALLAAIDQKQLRVALDVFADEPAGGEAEFAATEIAQRVTCTPHIGASTAQAEEAVADEVVRIVEVFLRTGRPPGAVNLCERSPATHNLVIRHFNRVGVLAGVLDGLREEGINIEEMENTVFEGAAAACCTIRLDRAPSESLLAAFAEQRDVLHVLVEAER
jgi:D-3-phosphoglycerate dehydrogenase